MTKILIVDDHEATLMMLDEVFKRVGFTTHLATCGIQAIEIAERDELDVILLDDKMPFMDGLEVLKRIKEINHDIPIILMSTYGENIVKQEIMELGASSFVTKPFDIYEIRDIVSSFLMIKK